MKQKAKLFVMLMTMLIGHISAWGDTAGFTLTGMPSGANGNATGTITGTANEVWTWNLNGSTYGTTESNTSSWQIGSRNNPATSASFSTSGINGTITKVVVRCSSYAAATVSVTVGDNAFGSNQTSSTGQSLSNLTFEGNASGQIVVTMTNATSGRYMLLKSIIVTYASSAVATPSFTLAEGTYYTSPQTTQISCPTTDATIYYTTDGSDPLSSNTRQPYTSNISITKTTTLKAVAVKGNDVSAVATATYTLKVGTPYISVPTGIYSTSQSVSIYCSNTPGATIYYTTDGTDPSNSNTRIEYTSAFTVNSTTTVRAIATYGEMDESDEATSVITLQVSTPTFSPAAGVYTDPQTVTMVCATEGATIYFTIDGSTPTSNSTPYNGSIIVNETTTIKAIAVLNGWNNSDVATATYTIREISSGAFIKATSESDLAEGMEVIIVNEEAFKTMGAQQTNNFYTVGVTIDNSSTPYIAEPYDDATILTLEGSSGAWYFKTSNNEYLYAASSGSNYLKTEETADDNAKATISFNNGDATIKFQGSNTHNLLRYNSSSTLFSCYASGQKAVQLYYRNSGVTVAKPVFNPTGGEITENTEITITASEGTTIYYTTDGSDPVVGGQLSSTAKVYSGALTFSKAVTLKAIAMDGEGHFSKIATASYSYVGTVVLPYYENFDEGLGNFTTNPSGTKVAWEFQVNHDATTYGEERKYAYVSGGTYTSKSQYVGEDRLVSPVFDLSDYTTASMSFIHAGHWFGTSSDGTDSGDPDDAAKKACCHLQVKEENGSWIDISDRISNWFVQRRENGHNMYDRVNSGDIDLSDYVGNKIQISFYFTSTSSQSGTWNVLKFAVTGTEPEQESYEAVNMKTDGYVTYVVQNDIDWVKTLAKNTTADGNNINIHGYKVVEFSQNTAVFVEFGCNNASTTIDKWYSEPIIPAETPIILKGTEGDNNLVIAKTDDVIRKPEGNLLKPSYGDVTAAEGQHLLVFQKEPEWTASDPYNHYAFYKLKTGRTIPNRKAYLNGTDVQEEVSVQSSNPVNGIYLLEDLGKDSTLGTDGIADLDGRTAPTFDLNAPIYDLSGRRVNGQLHKGIYIVNGRKVIIK